MWDILVTHCPLNHYLTHLKTIQEWSFKKCLIISKNKTEFWNVHFQTDHVLTKWIYILTVFIIFFFYHKLLSKCFNKIKTPKKISQATIEQFFRMPVQLKLLQNHWNINHVYCLAVFLAGGPASTLAPVSSSSWLGLHYTEWATNHKYVLFHRLSQLCVGLTTNPSQKRLVTPWLQEKLLHFDPGQTYKFKGHPLL